MVTKRIRSEYMKKFKDPKWETYTKCYEEMLKYRLTRRLLEHTHNPWFWNGSDSDSESGGLSPPPPDKNRVQSETTGAELEECEGARGAEQHPRPTDVPRLPLLEEEDEKAGAVPAAHGSQKGAQEEREAQRACSNRGSKHVTLGHREGDPERGPAGSRPLQTKPSKLSKKARHLQRVRPVVTRPPREDSKDKHPFALYGSGEKHADIAGRKTHNVRPAASTNEIYESALRAKTRREVERQIQTQRTERRRAKSVDLGKTRKVVQPEFNPWLTEYMRCFSARSR